MLTKTQFTRAMKNAEFVLTQIAGAVPGDNIVVIADSESYEASNLFCQSAKALGVHSILIDLDVYGGEEGYDHLPIMEPLRQAILHADISFMTTPQIKTSFAHFLGSQNAGDTALTGKGKRFIFEIKGLERWELREEEVLRNRARAQALYAWLRSAREVRVTTARGTDLRVPVGSVPDGMYPVMGIIPFYSEVAIVPKLGSVNGTVVSDGASERAYHQRGFPIRPNIDGHRELYKQPMTMVYRDSLLVEYSGDPVQVARLDTLMEKVSPKPELCDELGIVTTTSPENDRYGWQVDHSHQSRCVHVAIGNNHDREHIIHSTEHIDFDVYEPTIQVDGRTIFDGEVFDDPLIFSMGERYRQG